jgi:hypothetical protein
VVLVQRIVVGDPLAEQQSANAVRVPNALLQQLRALARDPTAVFLTRAWWYGHRADPRLAALPGHQCAQQRLAVNRIRLGAPVASRHSNRRRINDDAVGLEQAMNPETIEPDFVDRDNLDRRGNAFARLCSSAAREGLAVCARHRRRACTWTSCCCRARVLLRPRSNDSALMRRTKWHGLPGCRFAVDQEEL